jgi:hypothetical protein
MHTIFIGIDVSTSRRPFAYAALDSDRRLVAVGEGELLEVLAFAAGQPGVTAAISAPARPNQGLMKKEAVRKTLDPVPPPGKFTNLRQAEYELEKIGIATVHTPSIEENCQPWVKKGFMLYRNLETLDFQDFPSDHPRQRLETHSEAGFISLLGQPLLSAATLEGRLQRQLILYEQDLPVNDPMRFFEEVTSHRLKRGILPTENILSELELSAIMAAYIAWLTMSHPEKIAQYGNPQEGLIILPARSNIPQKFEHPESPFQNKAYSLPFIDKGVIE